MQIRDRVLICPRCNEGRLHQVQTTVVSREGEDQKGASVTIQSGAYLCGRDSGPLMDVGTVTPDECLGRRDSLQVTFFCEECGRDDLELRFVQHKGHTLVEWKTDA
jgi:hypothetical protein